MNLLRIPHLVCTIILLAIYVAGQSSVADSELQLGARAYKDARFEQAIVHFKNAVAADPSNLRARLYLATAYAAQYIPGATTLENRDLGQQAIEQYQKALEIDPSNVNATKGIAYLSLQMKEFEEAKKYYRRSAELDPKDPESYYCIGVVDWTQTYQPRMELRAKLGLKPEEPLIARPECAQMRAANLDLVSDGVEMLSKAIQLRPDYDDAMAYLNLVYRERADIQCGDERAHSADLQTADEWVDKTMQ